MQSVTVNNAEEHEAAASRAPGWPGSAERAAMLSEIRRLYPAIYGHAPIIPVERMNRMQLTSILDSCRDLAADLLRERALHRIGRRTRRPSMHPDYT